MREIDVSSLSAWFGSNQVLHDINLGIERSAATAIIGPSGCGKSTLIRCLNRMHEEVRGARVEGKVLFDGEDIYDPRIDPVVIRRRIGMVFQKPNPFPTMSILENAIAGLKLLGRLPKAELQERGENALRAAGLWDEVKDRLGDPGGRLSGGLLMDEPASALDPSSTLRIEELVTELKDRYTVVIVTHNMQQAARVADWTLFMLYGEVVEFGPTSRIFTTPEDQRTEDYVTGRFG